MKDGAGPRRGDGRLQLAALGLGLFGAAIVTAALWSAAAAARAASSAGRIGARFSAFIEDLPIMPGLSEIDEGYAFGLYPRGRLAAARLVGATDPAVVRGFYAATLSQLGWSPSDAEPYVYHRADERLIFLVEPRLRSRNRPARGLQAVFLITPATTGQAPPRCEAKR